jgi:hypothetical protein
MTLSRVASGHWESKVVAIFQSKISVPDDPYAAGDNAAFQACIGPVLRAQIAFRRYAEFRASVIHISKRSSCFRLSQKFPLGFNVNHGPAEAIRVRAKSHSDQPGGNAAFFASF